MGRGVCVSIPRAEAARCDAVCGDGSKGEWESRNERKGEVVGRRESELEGGGIGS